MAVSKFRFVPLQVEEAAWVLLVEYPQNTRQFTLAERHETPPAAALLIAIEGLRQPAVAKPLEVLDSRQDRYTARGGFRPGTVADHLEYDLPPRPAGVKNEPKGVEDPVAPHSDAKAL